MIGADDLQKRLNFVGSVSFISQDGKYVDTKVP